MSALLRVPLLGKFKRSRYVGREEKIFLACSLVSIIVLFCTSVYNIILMPLPTVQLTFSIFMLVNIIFQVLYVLYGILREQKYFLIFAMINFALLYIYSLLTYFTVNQEIYLVKAIRLLLCSLFMPASMVSGVVTLLNYKNYGAYIFFQAGAIHEKQKKFHPYLNALSLLILDFNARVNISILYSLPRLEDRVVINSADMILISSSLAVTLMTSLTCFLVLRFELAYIMTAASVCEFLQEGFSIYLIKKITHQFPNEHPLITFTLVFCILTVIYAFVVRLALGVLLFKSGKNFNQGIYMEVFSSEDV